MSILHYTNETTAELYIYDPIGADFFGDGLTAKSVRDELKNAGKVKNLTVRINSPGGSVFEGQAIYNLLRDFKATKSVKVDGIAASIASVIAMAGDEVEIADNGVIMIHDPYGFTMGDADEHRKQAEVLDQLKETIITVYENKTGQKRPKLAELMAAETWMDAKQALDLGFADTIKANAPKVAASIGPDWFAKFGMKAPPPSVFEGATVAPPKSFAAMSKPERAAYYAEQKLRLTAGTKPA